MLSTGVSQTPTLVTTFSEATDHQPGQVQAVKHTQKHTSLFLKKKATCEPSLYYDFKSESGDSRSMFISTVSWGAPQEPCAAHWSLSTARTSLRSLSLTGTVHF